MPARARLAAPALAGLALALAGCQGQGHAALQAFGEALAFAALLALALLALALVVYAVLWIGLLRALRRAPQAPLRAFALALVAALLHAGLVLLASEFRFGQGSAAFLLLVAGVIPLAALAYAAGLAWRGGVARWPLLVAALLVLAWLTPLVENWRLRPLAELPGRVTALAAVSLHCCAHLSTGEVACLGANWQGQRGDGSEHAIDGPTLARGIDDATALAIGQDITCVLRPAGPALCWGGDDRLPVPGDRRVPWELPLGDDLTALVASEGQIVGLARDGTLRGWPTPPAIDVPRGARLVGDDDFDGAWFCVVDESHAIECWRPRRPADRVRLDLPPATHLALDADAEILCAAEAADTIRCHDLDQRRAPRTLTVPGLRQLVAVDDDGTFCALAHGGEATCWRGDGPTFTPSGLDRVDHLLAGGGVLCGVAGGERRCITLGDQPNTCTLALLARDIAP